MESRERPLRSAHRLSSRHREDHAEARRFKEVSAENRTRGEASWDRELENRIAGKAGSILKLSTRKRLGILTQEGGGVGGVWKFVGKDGKGGTERERMEPEPVGERG